ncbi:Translation initiation factor IF-2 [Labeo rohita]|uniref:Translation initiation factor IF-2 n=1 Tax=Labeo rohita TaxID=84645 RepID=A0ABQ8L5Q5_LABRO|nr:Translation initiation factor IF-2 [Labeo rohita]
MASSSLVSIGVCQSSSSTRFPCRSGSTLVSRPPTSTSGLHSSGCASCTLWLRRVPHESSVTPPRPFGSLPTPLSPKPPTPPCPSKSLASPWLIGSPFTPQAPPPPALPLPVCPLESSALPSPWLLPPSAPLWTITMVAWWLGLCLTPPAPGPPGILLGSSLHQSLCGPSYLLSDSSLRQSHPGHLRDSLPALLQPLLLNPCPPSTVAPSTAPSRRGQTLTVLNSFVVVCFT